MTCIVAIEKNGKVYMGGDSQASAGWDKNIIGFKKVFRNGDFMIGYTSSFRMGQLLEFELTVTKQEKESDMQYMVTKFIPAVRDLFKAKGYSKIENNQEAGGFFLVGYKGRVYEIEDDFQVMRRKNGLNAVGCGYAYALGSLATNKTEDPKNKVLTALKVSGMLSSGVCGPYYVEVR